MPLSIITEHPSSSSHLSRLKQLREKRLDNESEVKIISKSTAPSINWLDTPVGFKNKSKKERVSSFSPIDEEDEEPISPKKSSYSPRLNTRNGRILEFSPSTSNETLTPEGSPVSGRKPTPPKTKNHNSGKEYRKSQPHRKTVSPKKGGKRKTQRRLKKQKK